MVLDSGGRAGILVPIALLVGIIRFEKGIVR